MIQSKDLYIMDIQLQNLTADYECSPELSNLIDTFGSYLNIIAFRMAELEEENQRLNDCVIEINIG